MSGNGDTTNRVADVLRFLGLSAEQRRGDRRPGESVHRAPSAEEMRAATLSALLQQNSDGAQVLIDLLETRVTEANASAHESAANHAVCVGFLGAEAALRRLLDDLKRLRG